MKTISKTGKYVKFSKIKDKPYLTFVANNKDDNRFKLLNMLRDKDKNISCYQNCKQKEQKDKFEKILYISYNIWGQPLKHIHVYFNFESGTIRTENSEEYKVINDYNYIYKLQKTQIKSTNGITGLYSHIVDCMHVDSGFNSIMYKLLSKL